MILLTMKSSRSRTVLPPPNGSNPDIRLKPSTQGSDRIIIIMPFISEAFFLLQPVRSIEQDIIFSKTAITVDIAANAMNMKNRLPHSLPPGILLKIFGRVTKIKFGPLSGLTPNEKQAGKIIRPENSATNVSSAAILTDSPARECSLPM